MFTLEIFQDIHADNPYDTWDMATQMYSPNEGYTTKGALPPVYEECTICGQDVEHYCSCLIEEGVDYRSPHDYWRDGVVYLPGGEVNYEAASEKEWLELPVSGPEHHKTVLRHPIVVAGNRNLYTDEFTVYEEPDFSRDYDTYVSIDEETLQREWKGDVEAARLAAVGEFEQFSTWSSGDVWSLSLYKVTVCECCGAEDKEHIDGVSGFYGSDYVVEGIKEHLAPEHHHLIDEAWENRY